MFQTMGNMELCWVHAWTDDRDDRQRDKWWMTHTAGSLPVDAQSVVEERLRCKALSSTVGAFGAIKQNPDLGSVLTQHSSLADVSMFLESPNVSSAKVTATQSQNSVAKT